MKYGRILAHSISNVNNGLTFGPSLIKELAITQDTNTCKTTIGKSSTNKNRLKILPFRVPFHEYGESENGTEVSR